MTTYIILDLDNTISNDAWRIEHIDWQHSDLERRYFNYHALAAFDEPGNHELWEGSPHKIIISTARPVMFRTITEEWLRRHGVPYDVLLMRNNGSHMPSAQLKALHLGWLHEFYLIDPSSIVHAYDDREDVCAMFRANGIEATAKPLHNNCAWTAPAKVPA